MPGQSWTNFYSSLFSEAGDKILGLARGREVLTSDPVSVPVLDHPLPYKHVWETSYHVGVFFSYKTSGVSLPFSIIFAIVNTQILSPLSHHRLKAPFTFPAINTYQIPFFFCMCDFKKISKLKTLKCLFLFCCLVAGSPCNSQSSLHFGNPPV